MDSITFSYIGELLTENIWLRLLAVAVALYLIDVLARVVLSGAIRRLVRGKKYQSKRAEKQREDTLIMVMSRTLAVALWIIGIFFVLSQLDFNWSGLLAGAGLIGIVIGFGAQKVAGDFISGFFILLENQFSVGDVVEVKDMAYGVVEKIDLRTTYIRDLDGGLHIIANGDIVNMANHSYGWATALVYLWFDYDSDINQIEKIMNKVGSDLAKDEQWGKELHGPVSFDRVEDYGSDGLKVRALGETAPGMQWAVAGEFRRRLKPQLDKAGIKIAYPRRIIEKR